jgi:hypothetical protein
LLFPASRNSCSAGTGIPVPAFLPGICRNLKKVQEFLRSCGISVPAWLAGIPCSWQEHIPYSKVFLAGIPALDLAGTGIPVPAQEFPTGN